MDNFADILNSSDTRDGEYQTRQATPTPLRSHRLIGRARKTNKVFKPFTPPRFVVDRGNAPNQECAKALSTPLHNCESLECNIPESLGSFKTPPCGSYSGKLTESKFRYYEKNQKCRDVSEYYSAGTMRSSISNIMENSFDANDYTTPILVEEFSSPRRNEKDTVLDFEPRNDIKLLATSVLPVRFRKVFGFYNFNRMQTECFSSIYHTDQNCVISAPTGSGKTTLFELAILRLLSLQSIHGDRSKIIYLAPTKALCAEKHKSWSKMFSCLDLSIGLLTSDTYFLEAGNVRNCKVIISTPEKLDLLTRKQANCENILSLIKLLLIDEVHTLNDSRGSTLEVVTARVKKWSLNLRIVAISASVSNVNDISTWLKKRGSSIPATLFAFDDTYRSVHLEKEVFGYSPLKKNDFQFDVLLNSKLFEIIRQYWNAKPTLIFCPTRNSCIRTARYLSDSYPSSFRCNKKTSLCFDDKDLRQFVYNGIAYHHAGLSWSDRSKIENLYANGQVNILFSTSTLSLGVNLPTYLVIIKGTRCWIDGAFNEYTKTDVLQMMGRAGRPQYETEGKTVIMTSLSTRPRYEKFDIGRDIVESSLHLSFAENLVVEIALGTIRTVDDAVKWLKSTYLYIRFMSNTSYYKDILQQFNHSLSSNDILIEFCERQLFRLISEEVVCIGKDNYYGCTVYGELMTKYYMLLPTMRDIIKSEPQKSVLDILMLFSRSYESSGIYLRYQEKRLYQEINLSPDLKYPLKTKEFLNSDKIILLVQYELGGLEFPTYAGSMKLLSNFLNDKLLVFKQANRILRCLVDSFVYKKDHISLLNTLLLLRCINGRCWEKSPMELRQLSGIELSDVKKIAQHNVNSLLDAKNLNSVQLGHFLEKETEAVDIITKNLSCLPVLGITAAIRSDKIPDFEKIIVNLSVSFGVKNAKESYTWQDKYVSLCIIIGISTGELLDYRKISITRFNEVDLKTIYLSANITDRRQKIICNICAEEIVGISSTCVLNFNTIAQSKFDNIIEKNSISELDYDLDSSKGFETVRIQNSDSDSDSMSDLDFDDLFFDHVRGIRTKPNSEIKKVNCNNGEFVTEEKVNKRRLRPDGNLECNHFCKNKTQCRHLCCKEGIPILKKSKRTSHAIKRPKDSIATTTKCDLQNYDPLVTKELHKIDRNDAINKSGKEVLCDSRSTKRRKRKKLKLGKNRGLFNFSSGGIFDGLGDEGLDDNFFNLKRLPIAYANSLKNNLENQTTKFISPDKINSLECEEKENKEGMSKPNGISDKFPVINYNSCNNTTEKDSVKKEADNFECKHTAMSTIEAKDDLELLNSLFGSDVELEI